MICLKDLNIKEVEKYINDDNFFLYKTEKELGSFLKGLIFVNLLTVAENMGID